MQTNKLAKKSPLGGSGGVPKDDNDYSTESIKKTLKDNGLAATETVTVRNAVTGKETQVVIERDGTPESKLIIALADKGKTRDQKDAIMGMYLFERGKDNASFLMDLFRYKGGHTKETRAFKSQMRFDFEQFVSVFSNHLDSMARAIIAEFKIDFEEFLRFAKGYATFLNDNPGTPLITYNNKEVEKSIFGIMFEEDAAVIQIALRNISEADRFRDVVRTVAANREKDRGKGIYIDAFGKPYSVTDEEIDIHAIIDEDRKRIADLEAEDLKE